MTSLLESSPYFRFAYNKEWGANSFEAGVHGMISYVYGTPFAGAPLTSQPGGPVSTYHDIGLDAQYQYVLDPHYFAAHARVTRELMNNPMNPGITNWQGLQASNATDNLTETYMDATYV
ncbi:cytochrome c1 signal peptide protein, partial [mine drainage metagenome]